MAVILFPNRNEMSRFCNSTLRGSVLCPETVCRDIKPEGELYDDESDVLSEIQKTVLMVNKKVEELIKEIPFSDILSAFIYENSYTNWRDRSHFIRLCLESINKETDEDVLSIMALMEVFYLSWLIADEELDETEKCEGKQAWFKEHGKMTGIIASNIIQAITAKVFQRITKNKNLDADRLQNMWEVFAKMWDETRYGFYKDIKATVDLERIIEKIKYSTHEKEELELDYLNRIGLIWGSHFEGGIKLASSLFPEIEEERFELLGRIGRLWGKMLKIRDDIVDIVGDKYGLGREPLEDIIISDGTIKVRKTFPLIRYICLVTERNQEVKGEDFLCYRDLLTYAIEDSKRKLQSIASEITHLLDKLPGSDAKNSLMKFMNLVATIRWRGNNDELR